MNWYSVEIEIKGDNGFLHELNETINDYNDAARRQLYYNTAHICDLAEKLRINSKIYDDKTIFISESRINSIGHLIMITSFAGLNKKSFQDTIIRFLNNFDDKIAGINFVFSDWP